MSLHCLYISERPKGSKNYVQDIDCLSCKQVHSYLLINKIFMSACDLFRYPVKPHLVHGRYPHYRKAQPH